MDDYLAKPVRLEDVRAIVEKWGPAAGKTVETTTAPTGIQDMSGANPLPQASSTPIPAEDEAPVEMERLLDFTSGDPESLRELVTLYLEQTATQIEQLTTAVQAGNAGEVRRVAHSCAGASATCGMRRLVPLLRELERQGYEQKLTNAAELSRQVGNEFECIRVFLEAQLAHQPTLAAKR
jgi:HPt (histidine-containing phosphotransfer) domain-containing protein